jgi:signal transduction histidine kinase
MPDETCEMTETAPVRILLVDDEVAQMEPLRVTLKAQGYETVGFTGGQAALAALREAPFELLLADLTMPEMDGITLLNRAQEIDPNLVGIIMTGHGRIDTAVEAMKVGAIDYVLKPFQVSDLLPVLARALKIRRLRMENAELTRRVALHTAELEASNKELESFTYSVSHDLRAPLRAIDAFARILLEDFGTQIPAEAAELLGRISAGVERTRQLMDALIRFSRLGRQSLTKCDVNVASLVREVLEEFRQEREGRQIEVRVGTLPDCLGDPALLKAVFTNLVSNAFKFTRRRERAEIEIGCREEEGRKIYFVRDNGAGFDMKYADRLFGVFQRLHRLEDFEGTGVGLSIVQRIIQRHGGRIWAEAAVDKGAAFYFTLE